MAIARVTREQRVKEYKMINIVLGQPVLEISRTGKGRLQRDSSIEMEDLCKMAIVVQPKWRSSQNGIALVNSYLVFRHWYSCLSHIELNSMDWYLLLFQFMDLVPLDEITHRLVAQNRMGLQRNPVSHQSI